MVGREEIEERQSVSHVASNFGSGFRTTLFHRELLRYEHELAPFRRRDRRAFELAKTAHTEIHKHTKKIGNKLN